MSKSILNNSQIKKVNGAGVYSYIKGGLKIAFGAAMGLSSINIFDKKILNSLIGEEKSLNTIAGIGLAASLASIASGINDIVDEKRISKLEEKIK